MSADPRAAIAAADAALGIKFGSTRTEAVPIGPGHEVLAIGDHGWENHLEGDLWSRTLNEVVAGLHTAYVPLVADMCERYDVIPAPCGLVGISAVVHGYLALDVGGNLLAPSRTWRSTNTRRAADEFTRLFGFSIPLHWSITHLHRAVLDSEEHAPRVIHLTTLIDRVCHQLIGRHILGVEDASGMFPIDSEAGTCMESYLNQYRALVETQVPRHLRDVLPTVLNAGEDTGTLTPEGAAFIDPTGTFQVGVALYLLEGDADIGMIVTNAITQCTGSISYGTPVFLMAVLERSLAELHAEINMVMTPDDSPVAIIHSNDGVPELDTWVGWFADFVCLVGAGVSAPAAYDVPYNRAFTDKANASGVTVYNTLFTEPLIDQEVAQPVFMHMIDVCVNLASVMHAQLMSIFAAVRINVDIFRGEGAHLDSPFAHGGLFEIPGAVRQIFADSLNIPVSAGDTADEGSTWGIAVLACYRVVLVGDEATPALSDYPSERVFTGASVSTLEPTHEGVTGYERFLDAYRVALSGMEAITQGSTH